MSGRIVAALAALALGLGCQTAPEGAVAIVNVNVLPMDSERVLMRQTVVTSDGQISALGPASEVKVPSGALTLNGNGLYLMPGLTEMHAHLPAADAPPEEVDRILFLFLSNGVTTVRGMLGNASHLELRQQIEDGTRLGPTIYAAGPAFRGSDELTPEAARQRVREQHEAGYDLLKILEGLSVETYDAIADEATLAGIPFAGHVPNEVGLLDALAAGQASVDHLDNYIEALEADNSPIKNADPSIRSRDIGLHADLAKIPALVAATKLADASVVPTMALWETFNADVPVETYAEIDELKYLPRETVDAWIESQTSRRARLNAQAGARVIEIRKQVLKALQDEGARIVFGTDAPQIFNVPGFSIHREIGIMASAGLTPYEILTSATVNAAEHFGNDSFGRIEVGARADLLLLGANPLDDASNVSKRHGVMVRGHWLSEPAIQARLSELAASAGH